MNRFGAGLSTAVDPAVAAAEAAAAAVAGFDTEPDLVCVFASAGYGAAAAEVGPAVAARIRTGALVGAVGVSGVIGLAREVEEGPAVGVWAASLPGTAIEPFHLTLQVVDGATAVVGWPTGDVAAADATVLLLADPYTFPTDALLGRMNDEAPGLPIVGGLAGGGRPGAARLFVGDETTAAGAVGVVLGGAGCMPLVSQGCRPIGPELVVTAVDGNAVLGLAGMPALERLREIVANLSPIDRVRVAGGLLVGFVLNENQPEYGVGDYLVRALLGADEERGSLICGDVPRVGQTFRFHVRDEVSADAELAAVLRDGAQRLAGPPGGALLFSCSGRGSQMFSVPDHDAGEVASMLGVPTAGLFCQGEIGPVGGANHLHGFTATVALFPS